MADLTAELDRIAAELRTSGASDADTARLLAVVEAVLKLADEWGAEAARQRRKAADLTERGSMIVSAAQNARAQTHQGCTDALREAIAREITPV